MKDLSKMIEIKCDCSETVDWHELKEFQGGLKSRDDSDYEKMKTSLLEYGWSFVMYYWNDGKTKWILDGHNRKQVLQKLEKEGYFIPPLPAIEVYAKDKNEAKQKLLRLNSQYGHMTKESVLDFADGLDLNFDEIALPDSIIDFSSVLGDEEAETEDRSGNLVKNYVVPPFSILDTRQKYWQDRKKTWLEKTGNLSETRDGEFGKVGGGKETVFSSINGGTSNFDPVLAEIMYKWFCTGGGIFSTRLVENRQRALLQAS